MSWIGNALGSAIGLVAILLGALYNAKLTRKRDDRIMKDEAKSIAVAIGTEMGAYAEHLCGRIAQASMGGEGRTPGIVAAMRPLQPVVWQSLAGRVGELGADTSERVVSGWMLLQWHAQLLEASIADIQADQWSAETMRQRCELVKQDLPKIADTVLALTGKRPDLEYALP